MSTNTVEAELLLEELDDDDTRPKSVAFTADSRRLAVGFNDGTVQIVELAPQQPNL
jgi:hypothetical protein